MLREQDIKTNLKHVQDNFPDLYESAYSRLTGKGTKEALKKGDRATINLLHSYILQEIGKSNEKYL
jgi:sorbitol-specific phosphotransferase system component IIA